MSRHIPCRISRYASDARKLREWIQTRSFARYETDAQHIRRHGRARNRLYEVRIAGEPHPLVMKVSQVSERYRWSRRVELYLKQLTKDHSLNAFRACCALRDAGVSVATPIAWWRVRTGLLSYKGYFLYRKVHAVCSVADYLGQADLPADCRAEIRGRLVALVRSIHRANWRHGDMQMNNLLITAPNADAARDASLATDGSSRTSGDSARANERLNIDTLRACSITVVDYDRCAPTRIRLTPPPVKRFFDLRCLIYLSDSRASDDHILSDYLGSDATPFWRATLRFWKSGGFSLAKRSRKWRRRKKSAHLKHPR